MVLSDLQTNKQESALILVVEDDDVTRLTLSKVLSKSGFRVIEANNGQDGFSMFIKEAPDLILMDVMMPVMDAMPPPKRFVTTKKTAPCRF